MFWFAIITLIVMILLGVIGVVCGFRLLRIREGSSNKKWEARILFTSLADTLICIVAIGAVATKALGPLETLAAAWVLVLLIYFASVKNSEPVD